MLIPLDSISGLVHVLRGYAALPLLYDSLTCKKQIKKVQGEESDGVHSCSMPIVSIAPKGMFLITTAFAMLEVDRAAVCKDDLHHCCKRVSQLSENKYTKNQ